VEEVDLPTPADVSSPPIVLDMTRFATSQHMTTASGAMAQPADQVAPLMSTVPWTDLFVGLDC